MKTIVEKITAIATNLGWNVRIDTSKTNLIEFEFQQYTSMGQDLVFYAEMRGGNLDSFWMKQKIIMRVLTPITKPVYGLAQTDMARMVRLITLRI